MTAAIATALLVIATAGTVLIAIGVGLAVGMLISSARQRRR